MEMTNSRTKLFQARFCILFIFWTILLFFTLPIWAQNANTLAPKINFESFDSLKTLPYMGGSLMYNKMDLNYSHLKAGGNYPVRFSTFTKVPIQGSENTNANTNVSSETDQYYDYLEIPEQVQWGIITITYISTSEMVFYMTRWDYSGNPLPKITGRLVLNKPGLDVSNDGLVDLEYVSSINPARPKNKQISYLRLVSSETELRAAMYYYSPTMDPGQPNKSGGNVGFNIQGFALFREDFMATKAVKPPQNQQPLVRTLTLKNNKAIPKLNIIAGDYVIINNAAERSYKKIQAVNANKGLLTFVPFSKQENLEQSALNAIQLMAADIERTEEIEDMESSMKADSQTPFLQNASSNDPDPELEEYLAKVEQCENLFDSAKVKRNLLNLSGLYFDLKPKDRRIARIKFNKFKYGIGLTVSVRVLFLKVKSDVKVLKLWAGDLEIDAFEVGQIARVDLFKIPNLKMEIPLDGGSGVILKLELGLGGGLRLGLDSKVKGHFRAAMMQVKGNRTESSAGLFYIHGNKIEDYNITAKYFDASITEFGDTLDVYLQPYIEPYAKLVLVEIFYAGLFGEAYLKPTLSAKPHPTEIIEELYFKLYGGYNAKFRIGADFGFFKPKLDVWTICNEEELLYEKLLYQAFPHLPDLVISDLRLEPIDPDPGQDVKIYATIKNNSTEDIPANDNVIVGFWVAGNYLGDLLIPAVSLKAGASSTGACSGRWIAQQGSVLFKAIADKDNLIKEINEDNNIIEKNVNISDSIEPPVPPSECGKIEAGFGLGIGQMLHSCDGRFRLMLQHDGNLVLSQNNLALWASHTDNRLVFGLYMQGDGNLVLLGKSGKQLWSSNTAGNAGAWLALQNDGNMVIYTAQGQPLWASDTVMPNPPVLPPSCGAIPAGYGLGVGQEVRSCDGRFRLVLQGDNNLVLYQIGVRPLWASQTANSALQAFGLYMQGDGNLVLASTTGKAIWSSQTNGHPGAWLAIQDDGNMVIYAAQNQPIWATNTVVPPPQACGYLAPDKGLNLGESIYSCDGRFRLMLQHDGNLVLSQGSTALWASHTDGQPVDGVYMQGDGNLVIYTQSGNAVWSSQTNGYPGAWLALQNDGNLVIYTTQMQPIWASNTAGH